MRPTELEEKIVGWLEDDCALGWEVIDSLRPKVRRACHAPFDSVACWYDGWGRIALGFYAARDSESERMKLGLAINGKSPHLLAVKYHTGTVQ
jgi:hypothetical protein